MTENDLKISKGYKKDSLMTRFKSRGFKEGGDNMTYKQKHIVYFIFQTAIECFTERVCINFLIR
jgi:hypothetical protein